MGRGKIRRRCRRRALVGAKSLGDLAITRRDVARKAQAVPAFSTTLSRHRRPRRFLDVSQVIAAASRQYALTRALVLVEFSIEPTERRDMMTLRTWRPSGEELMTTQSLY